VANVETPPSAEDLFKSAARLLFGSDWQREAARALGRDETALARFLLGERALEDGEQLYTDMLALMRRRAAEIAAMADRFEQTLAAEREKMQAEKAAAAPDQGI
jgi:phage shock protein A